MPAKYRGIQHEPSIPARRFLLQAGRPERLRVLLKSLGLQTGLASDGIVDIVTRRIPYSGYLFDY
jgi:hypothetical protein